MCEGGFGIGVAWEDKGSGGNHRSGVVVTRTRVIAHQRFWNRLLFSYRLRGSSEIHVYRVCFSRIGTDIVCLFSP